MALRIAENQARAREAGGIEIVLEVLKRYIENELACSCGCDALFCMIQNSRKQPTWNRKHVQFNFLSKSTGDAQMRAREVGGIEIALDIINKYITDPEICCSGCIVLSNISRADYSAQKEACERSGVGTILNVLRFHGGNKEVCEASCWAICVILSSQDMLSRFCTDDALSAVQECCEMHGDSEMVLECLLSLMREEDPRATDAVARGICTKEVLPKCGNDCGSDKGDYCPECCVQQRAFKCRTCGKGEARLYCETCWKRDHQGHECEEFFYPVRCGTK